MTYTLSHDANEEENLHFEPQPLSGMILQSQTTESVWLNKKGVGTSRGFTGGKQPHRKGEVFTVIGRTSA